MIKILQRVTLFALVLVLVLSTTWVALLLLTGLAGLRAGTETQIWLLHGGAGGAGFAGALLSLAFSRTIAKWCMKVRLITAENASTEKEKWLLAEVRRLATAAGLRNTPETGIYESFEVNAFATGPSSSRALIAVSQGLLDELPPESAGAVLAHEVAHIANGDMVTMTLLQGVINTMVLVAARFVARLISHAADARARGAVYLLTFISLQLLLSPFASLLVCYFSRAREFRADLGGARLVGPEHMRAGLNSLRATCGEVDDTHQALSTLRISGHSARALAALFLTHPLIEERLRRLSDIDLGPAQRARL